MNEPRSYCATCGKEVSVLRAASVRFSAKKKWYFCSSNHADTFVPPSKDPLAPLHRPYVDSMKVSLPAATNSAPLKEIELGARTSGPYLDLPQSEPLPPVETLDDPKLDAPEFDELDGAEPDEGESEVQRLRDEQRARHEAEPRKAGARLAASWFSSSESHTLFSIVLVGAAALATVLEGQAPWALLASACLLSILLGLSRKLRQTIDGGASAYHTEIEALLDSTARRIADEGIVSEVKAHELRAGEEIIVRASEVVVADGTISEGRAEISPWPGAEITRVASEGMRVVAGARVLSGTLQVVCTKTGRDRAYAGLSGGAGVRIEEETSVSQLARFLSVRLAPLLGLLAAVLVELQGGSYAEILGAAGSAWGAFASPLPRVALSLLTRAWLARAAKRGVVFLHEGLIDRAGQVSAAVFCARGTVLHGEPEVAEIHPFFGSSEAEILGLCAGAESVVHHPIAAAITRAASARGVVPDVCRGHHATPGQGVNCVTSKGEALVVGSRELLLEQRVSIALAEETLRGLENRGLSALLVAKDEHLVGVMALQDSLRAGARATVQLLLDEGIEPVLLSGESRATTEAVGHALSCEHVRPEVPGRHRATEVERLRDAGAVVAVIGTTPRDEAALSVATVPIILEGASVSRRDSPHAHERAIGIASGSVLSSAVALVAARRIRHFGQSGLRVGYLPTCIALLANLSQLAPIYFAPAVSVGSSILVTLLCQRWIQQPLFRAALSS